MAAPAHVSCSSTISCLCSRELHQQGKFYSLYLFSNILVPAALFHLFRSSVLHRALKEFQAVGCGGRLSSCKPLPVANWITQPFLFTACDTEELGANKKRGGGKLCSQKNTIFSVSAKAWRMKCYCRVKTACLSRGLTECSTWAWIFLEPQLCMNPKLSGEKKRHKWGVCGETVSA